MGSRRRMLIAAAVVAVLAALAFAGWWVVLRSDAPPEVDLAAAVSTLEQADPARGSTAPADTAPADTTPASTSPGDAAPTSTAPADTTPASTEPAEPPVGAEWVVDPAGGCFVGYRVQEELAGIGATTAVGRTPLVSGSMRISGTTVTSVDVEADLTGLDSDDSRRDRALRSQALETGTFPTATFTLAEPIELGTEPTDGEQFAGEAVGDLTLHGVTRRVTVPVEGQAADGSIVVVGSLPVEFADFDIDSPSSFVVLSVEDNGIVELQLVFRPA